MMLERLARWYLERRGIIVLDRCFVGMVFGHCVASQTDDITWHVTPLANPSPIIALNGSVVTRLVGSEEVS